MFTGTDLALRSILNGLLAVAAAAYGIGAVAIVIAVRVEPARASRFVRLAAIAKVGPPLVGLVCLGFMMDAIDLRSGHEADVLLRWPPLLPQVAALSVGAAFLAGLLAGSGPFATALATGGPMALLSGLVWAVAGIFLAAGWREDAETVKAGLQAAPADLVSFFKYVTLFPLVAMVMAAAGAGIGRVCHGLLGLPGGAQEGVRRTVSQSAEPAGRPSAPVPTPAAPPLPTPGPPVPDPARARSLPPLALPEPATNSGRWPSRLLIALGILLMVPAGCDLLTPKARLVISNPVGGAVLAHPPSEVALTYSDELSHSSSVRVRRTVTLDWAGGEEATGGTPVAEATGKSALSVDRRTLRARLPDGLPGGLYLVEWTTVRARGGKQRHGDLYFGVRMKVPRFIRNGGTSRERDPYERDRREMLGGGVLAVLLGIASRWYANALQGR